MINRLIVWIKATINDFFENNCPMHAAGLTYFSMLAIVPILCLLLYGAKMCGVDDYARREIDNRLNLLIMEVEHGQDLDIAVLAAPTEEEREKKRIAAVEFGSAARKISNALFDRIDKFDVGTLGWIGFVFLLWTVISSLGMVEVSFNQIWKVRKPRPIWKRAYIYLFISIVLPVLITLAMSVPMLWVVKTVIMKTFGALWATRWLGDGLIWLLDSSLFNFFIAFGFLSVAFAAVFKLMPNCKVASRPALYGGMITAVVSCLWIEVCAIAQIGIAKSSALYGSFAILPIVLAWLYMSWQIVLIGACCAHSLEATNK